ncbi:DNA repair protein RecO [Rhizobiales bacterium TNE-4]|nr:DNA repair protein RecO [Rhizobiales bacterium TNE-4]MBV1827372.1 DNA repair protein RecO [Rhizobiales bacterium TNE-4]
MEWRDAGIVLGLRRHGENAVVLEMMTRAHGRHLGVVRNGRSRTMQPVLQPGNHVDALWRARLEEHLGEWKIEPVDLRAATYMHSSVALYGLNHLAQLTRLLPERDPHPAIFESLAVIGENLTEAPLAAPLLIRYELAILAELGFGLDLSECAATGGQEELVYVSPKTGRAVSRVAGEPWRDRLFRLPAFLAGSLVSVPDWAEIEAGFALTAYFLERHVYGPRGLPPPEARGAFIAALRRDLSPSA